MIAVTLLVIVISVIPPAVEASSSRYYRGTLLATEGVNVHPDVWGRMLARSRMAR